MKVTDVISEPLGVSAGHDVGGPVSSLSEITHRAVHQLALALIFRYARS